MNKVYIIGAGPAGISAAIYLKRANIDVNVIYLDKSSLLLAHDIQNYYGIKTISGKELYLEGLEQAKNLNIPLFKEEVLEITQVNNGFEIQTNANKHECNIVVIATGSYRNRPNINNIKDYELKGVSYCAVCDGFFYRKKNIGIIGNGTYALHEANYLTNITDKLTIFTNGKEIVDIGLNKFPINNKTIKQLAGKEHLEKIIFEDESEEEIDGLFIAEGNAGSVDLAMKVGIMLNNDNIVVNESFETNVKGIYAIGDAIAGLKQVSKSVSDGALLATEIIKKNH